MKQTFKQQLGKNEQVYDLLTIEDGTMTLETHVEGRVLTYPCTTMTDQYGQEWVCYGKGSRIRLYDGKGDMDKRWAVTNPVTVVTNPVTEEKLNAERYSACKTEQKIGNSFNQTINQENNVATNQENKKTIKQTINKAKNNALLQFVGGVAAFLVGMVVMYNTGLLLPLGAAGLLVAGVVK